MVTISIASAATFACHFLLFFQTSLFWKLLLTATRSSSKAKVATIKTIVKNLKDRNQKSPKYYFILELAIQNTFHFNGKTVGKLNPIQWIEQSISNIKSLFGLTLGFWNKPGKETEHTEESGLQQLKKKKNEYSRVTEFSFKRERQCKWWISKKEKNKRVLQWPSKWIQSLYRALLRGGKNKSGQGHGFWFLSNRSFDRAPPFLPALLRNKEEKIALNYFWKKKKQNKRILWQETGDFSLSSKLYAGLRPI